VKYIGLAIKETQNARWRAVWPEAAERNHVITARNFNYYRRCGQGFENLEFSDIDELFVDQEIDEEELIYMVSNNEKANVESGDDGDDDITNKPNKFTSKDISEILQLASNFGHRSCY
jgi:hypothetical protein